MRPRILLRTHYQADEPRLVIAAVTDAASPVESRREDAIAKTLVKWARGQGHIISIPGAIYAVAAARALDLLNESLRWTSTGLAFGYIARRPEFSGELTGMGLADPEKRLYAKSYFTSAGALPLAFGTWLLEHGRVTDEELRRDSVIETLLVKVLDDYLTIATDVRDRNLIRRERDRLRRSKYGSATKRHKRYPLIATMRRLDLLQVEESEKERLGIRPDPEGRLTALVKAIPDVASLERLARAGSIGEALDQSLGGIPMPAWDSLTPAALIVDAYAFSTATGLRACPLSYLDDTLYAFRAMDPVQAAKPQAESLLEPIHKALPRDVRFHVDRRGRRAFVVLTASALARLGEMHKRP